MSDETKTQAHNEVASIDLLDLIDTINEVKYKCLDVASETRHSSLRDRYRHTALVLDSAVANLHWFRQQV